MSSILGTVTSTTSDTSGASWASLANMAISNVSVTSGAVQLLLFHMTCGTDATDRAALFRLTVNGSSVGSPIAAMFCDAVDEVNGVTMAWAVDGLTGTNSFDVEWQTHGSMPAVSTSTTLTRSFQVIELTDATLKVDVGTTSSDTATSGWSQISNMTGTFTTAANAMHLLVACGPILADSSDAHAYLRFAVDSTLEGPVSGTWVDATESQASTSMVYAKTGLSAASHTFELQWQEGQTSPSTHTSQNRTFQVIEITDAFSVGVNVSSTTLQDAPASWADMTNMSGSITPTDANSVILTLWCGTTRDGSDSTSEHMIADDGTREGPNIWQFPDEFEGNPGYMLAWAKDGITGSHTFSGQWQRVSSTNRTDPQERRFQVIDFEGGAAPPTGGGPPVFHRTYRNARVLSYVP